MAAGLGFARVVRVRSWCDAFPWPLPALLAAALSGCGIGRPPEAPPPPVSEAAAPAQPGSSSAKNADLVAFYTDVEGRLTASGKMRRETAPGDAPYTVDDLVRNFERIALYDEYVDLSGRYVHEETPAVLRRWAQPIRVGVMTGHSVSAAEAARDRANVAAFTRRLARLTGADMAMGEGDDVNFLILFMNEAERTAFGENVARRFPGFAPAVTSALRETPRDIFCVSYAFQDSETSPLYSAVIILIRAEHPPLTRLSCVQEEMAQAMGLPNDSVEARPSLFNDGREFALLTEHDEILLRMLYDPRLQPGMTAAEARPLLPAIARDAMAAQLEGDRVAATGVN